MLKTTVGTGMDSNTNRSRSGSNIVRPPVNTKITLLQQEVTKWGRDYANLQTVNQVLIRL